MQSLSASRLLKFKLLMILSLA